MARIVITLKRHELRLGLGRHFLQQGVEGVANPRDNNRPRLDAAVAVNALFQRRQLLQLLHGKTVLSLALTSCGKSSSAQIDPQAEYNTAIQDARTLTVAKISKHLTAIVPENSDLIWENNAPGTRVLVATWIGSQAACQVTPTRICRAVKQGRSVKTTGIIPGFL